MGWSCHAGAQLAPLPQGAIVGWQNSGFVTFNTAVSAKRPVPPPEGSRALTLGILAGFAQPQPGQLKPGRTEHPVVRWLRVVKPPWGAGNATVRSGWEMGCQLFGKNTSSVL